MMASLATADRYVSVEVSVSLNENSTAAFCTLTILDDLVPHGDGGSLCTVV